MSDEGFVVDTLNNGKDAWISCAACGGYISIVGNYNRLPPAPADFFGLRELPARVFARVVAHVCAAGVGRG